MDGMQLQAFQDIQLVSLLDTLVSLSAAFVLGALIGVERQYRQRTAGLRTNVLVALGAALFVDIANRLNGHLASVQVMAYVISGIGFLGAGVIMREEGNVRGLNTAATLWGSAAVGAACGADLVLEALFGALFVLAANTLLRPIVDTINRKPIDDGSAEVTNTVHVIAARSQQKAVLGRLEELLQASRYPTRDLAVQAFGEEDVGIEATLTATSVEAAQLDALVAQVSGLPGVRQAYWRPRTGE